jgi:pentose-5-phosphate-3-epimerase
MIDRIKLGCDLEADGEIDATTVPLVVAAGVDMWPGREFSMTA